ncbi:MAG: sodium:solute symporter family protein [Verrucomicrobiota bacterium JB022]|nr:sodium:solute symporter family protein [Verrucomicrobiota bacterium JB022]
MFGLPLIDLVVIALYFAVMLAIGFWSSRRISNQEDYFLAGRRFGKLVQTFAAFGQATSADNAVGTTTTTFNNGIAGIWSSMLYLFATPLYWVCTHWPRRMRILTLGDYFEERFNSKSMGSVYALIGSIAMMAFIGLGLTAMTKTIVAITPKDATEFTVAQQAEYRAAYEREVNRTTAIGMPVEVLSYEELAEREQLLATPSDQLTPEQQSRLLWLDGLKPAAVISHLSQNVLIWVVCIVVLLYATLGGLEAAFLTDMIQGVFIIILSLMLIPFAWAKINAVYGGETVMDALRTIHDKLPDSYFQIFGAPQTPDFTWYYILTLSIMAAVTVVTQPNGAVMAGSAKDEISNRAGTVIGNFLKRFCIIFWGVFGLAAIVLYEGRILQSDMLWGHATHDLLGPLNIGLVGLMIACLLAALMSTVDCLMITSASLLTHNLYQPLFPNQPAKNYVWAGRIFGFLVVVGGAAFALQFDTILQILKFIWEVNVMLAPAYWLGIKWRRANQPAAWSSIGVGAVLFLAIPALLPMANPGMRYSEDLLRTTNPAPTVMTEVAKEFDVQRREVEIMEWDRLDQVGNAPGERPLMIEVGTPYEHTYVFPKRSLFWSKGIQVDNEGRIYGGGLFSTELWILGKLGFNLESNPYALNETLRILFRTLLPFVIFIAVALLTKPDPKPVLDRFYAKMRTRVIPDPVKDKEELEKSLADPHRYDHILVFPKSQFEIYKWNREDWTGFIWSVIGVGVVLVVIWAAVSIGR